MLYYDSIVVVVLVQEEVLVADPEGTGGGCWKVRVPCHQREGGEHGDLRDGHRSPRQVVPGHRQQWVLSLYVPVYNNFQKILWKFVSML